jgi:hypothetical protein
MKRLLLVLILSVCATAGDTITSAKVVVDYYPIKPGSAKATDTDTLILKVEFKDDWPKSVKVYYQVESERGIDTFMNDYYPYERANMWDLKRYKKQSRSDYFGIKESK